MIVAVNARRLLSGNSEGIGYFTQEVFRHLTQRHPQHQFHLFFDRPFGKSFLFAPNVRGHVLSPPAHHPLLWKYWFDVKVPAALRKLKADVFFSPDGQCSLATKVPQCLVVHNLAFLHHADGYRKSHRFYYQHYTPRFIRKAQTVLTGSQVSRQDIINRYKTPEGKISVVYNGVKPAFKPIAFEEQDAVKEEHTGGAEFFLYAGTIQPQKDLINLLKAFSVFKRRLQSSMKLVLAGWPTWKNDEFLSLLETYKYKDDVVVTDDLEEPGLARLMASAYAFVHPSPEGFGVAEAMRCGVPVLAPTASAMEEITAGAALYFDPTNVDDMADKLMRIYKDENGRAALIRQGLLAAEGFVWEKAADGVWDAITRAAGSPA